MSKLHEIIALVSGKKKEAERDLTDLHQKSQKPALFSGISRRYEPKDAEDTDRLPEETQILQLRASEVLEKASAILTPVFDLVLTQDAGNQKAVADVEVDGKVLLTGVPVSTLIFLEKQLDNLHKFYDSLPVADPTKSWQEDPSNMCLKSISIKQRSVRKKVPLTLYEATKEHPAQVQLIEEDRVVGDWTTTETSGALTPKAKAELVQRARRLKDAVTVARERANQIEVEQQRQSKALFAYLHQ